MADCSLPSFLSGNYGESVDLGEICLGLLQVQTWMISWCGAVMKRGPVIVLGILTAAKIHPECSKQVSMVQSNMPQGTDPGKAAFTELPNLENGEAWSSCWCLQCWVSERREFSASMVIFWSSPFISLICFTTQMSFYHIMFNLEWIFG